MRETIHTSCNIQVYHTIRHVYAHVSLFRYALYGSEIISRYEDIIKATLPGYFVQMSAS